jgi:hypothetical protein
VSGRSRGLPGLRWVGEMMEGAARVLAFQRAPARAAANVAPVRRSRARKRPGTPLARRIGEVHKLAATGLDRCEISRRTGLSQDAVSLLLTRAHAQPDFSAGRGRFFRILRPRPAV